jgi:hypothetical protein
VRLPRSNEQRRSRNVDAHFQEQQITQLLGMAEVFRSHGSLLMTILALRTVGRFVGVWRMWRLHFDGFHIYTTSQLLGILLPMLVAGNVMFTWLGALTAVLWCLMYWLCLNERMAPAQKP